MEFTVWISTDAFGPAPTDYPEGLVHRTLEDIQVLIQSGLTGAVIRDDKGNDIGRWALTVEKKG